MSLFEIRIRPYVAADVPLLFEAVMESRPQLGPWMPWCHRDYSLEDSQTWVADRPAAFAAGTEYAFVIATTDGEFLGACGLNQIDRNDRRANLGYWVRSSRTGLGSATEATRQLARWAFENTDLQRLEIVAAVGNRASQAVASKSGAVPEGIARSRLLLHGVAHDAAIYAITRAQPLSPER